jgi:hypothetical protein
MKHKISLRFIRGGLVYRYRHRYCGILKYRYRHWSKVKTVCRLAIRKILFGHGLFVAVVSRVCCSATENDIVRIDCCTIVVPLSWYIVIKENYLVYVVEMARKSYAYNECLTHEKQYFHLVSFVWITNTDTDTAVFCNTAIPIPNTIPTFHFSHTKRVLAQHQLIVGLGLGLEA